MRSTLERFPLAIMVSVVGTVAACLLIMNNILPSTASVCLRLLPTCYLGMLLFVALPLFAQRYGLLLRQNMLLQAAGIGLLIIYFFTLTSWSTIPGSFTRFVLYAVGLLLLTAFAPFIKYGTVNGFWQFNKTLFLRILTTMLYATVLCVGVSLALVAINSLFSAHIDSRVHSIFWIIVAGIFCPIFFLQGLPTNFEKLDDLNVYPQGLKIFTQYILLPLVVLYLAILYAYEVKILLTLHWPVGWVAYLILVFSIGGILALLLIWPIRNQTGSSWVKTFSRFFYFALLPLIGLLFAAVCKRIAQYGITENRYFVLLLAVWLAGIAIYFLISSTKNIKWIPVSLCAMVFLSSFGPWGAFSVSKWSQLKRLDAILESYKYDSAEPTQLSTVMSQQDQFQVMALADYLVENYGFSVMQPYVSQDIKSIFKQDEAPASAYASEYTREIVTLMGIPYAAKWERDDNDAAERSFGTPDTEAVDVAGYDECIPNVIINTYNSQGDSVQARSYELSRDLLTVSLNSSKSIVALQLDKGEALSINLSETINSLLKTKEDSIPSKNRSFTVANARAVVTMKLKALELTKQSQVKSLAAVILVRRK